MAQTYFAAIQPGLEQVLLNDVRRMGGKRAKIVTGGVEFDAARKTLYRAHLEIATASRIWLRVDEFRARDAGELYKKTRRYGWERLLAGGTTIAIRAHSASSRLTHTDKISDAVRDGLDDRYRQDLADETPLSFGNTSDESAQMVMARIVDDRCQLSLDASGPLLHRRGWRTEAGNAPLRESLAAALLEAIEWKPEQGLCDPMCGSGTIAIEAARRALNIPAGMDRQFAFQNWQNFQPKRFGAIVADLKAQIGDTLPAPIVGSDRDEELIAIAERNAERAHVAGQIEFSDHATRDVTIPGDIDWVVTNPPYGARLDDDNGLRALIELWRRQKHRFGMAFLWPSARRDVVDGYNYKRLKRVVTFPNGGIRVDLWAAPPKNQS